MLKSKSTVNTQAAKLAIGLSIGMCAMVLFVFSTSAQQIAAAEHESVMVQDAQFAAISASATTTGTATTPNGNIGLRLPIIFASGGAIGTATVPDPGTSTNPPGTRIYYVPIIHIQ